MTTNSHTAEPQGLKDAALQVLRERVRGVDDEDSLMVTIMLIVHNNIIMNCKIALHVHKEQAEVAFTSSLA